MILDSLACLSSYRLLHPAIARVEEFLARQPLAALPDGRHEIEGAALYVGINVEPGRGEAGAVLEAHRRYVDIQVVLAGAERIGWRPLAECRELRFDYDPQRDILFYEDRPAAWFDLEPGQFALFLPTDAHAPLAAAGPVRKAVFKLAL
ncbi:MAG: YhcH/YjgK/YiaL family protein [Lentisphaeria bacterium]|jgi:YhcH/YjgK/YiaL family protein